MSKKLNQLPGHTRRLRRLGLALSLLLLATSARPALPDFDPSRVTWSGLQYEAGKIGITLGTHLDLDRGPVGGALIEPPEGSAKMPGSSGAWHLSIESRLLKRGDLLELWFDPADGSTFQRSELETGGKGKGDRIRIYRYTAEGIYQVTREPPETGPRPDPENWAKTDDYFARYPAELPAGTAVTQPAALFYLMSVAELSSPGDRIEAHVFSKGKVWRVKIEVLGTTQLDVDYKDGEKTVDGPVDALELSLDGQPAVGQAEAGEGFVFLGLTGDKRIFLSPTLRVPLQITGTIKHAGSGTVKLRSVVRD